MRKKTYELMHKDRRVARIDEAGHCRIFFRSFMPYNLYLEESEEMDSLVNNITNFNFWCATRVLTLDRKYAKEILNSIGVAQAVTDRQRAKIALSYRCTSLTDVFWVREKGEKTCFSDINLYENHLSNTFIDIALIYCAKRISCKGLVHKRLLSKGVAEIRKRVQAVKGWGRGGCGAGAACKPDMQVL